MSDNDDLTGKLNIRIVHPSWDLEIVSSLLEWPAVRCWLSGEPRSAPDGTALLGKYKDSRWISESIYFSGRWFRKEVISTLDQIEKQHKFFSELRESGGIIVIALSFPGSVNSGDVLDHSILKRFYDLGVDLGVEVFPGY